ncbi:MAG: hypothetical protein ACYTEQ_09400 [Planctomycetota bacterium]|jgi:hypothetical protein
MALTSQQQAFLQNFQTDFNKLALLLADIEQLRQIYDKRSYSTIDDADLAEVEITATQLSDAINMAAAFNDFLGNVAVAAGDRQGVMDRIRRL